MSNDETSGSSIDSEGSNDSITSFNEQPHMVEGTLTLTQFVSYFQQSLHMTVTEVSQDACDDYAK
jgi:hypothetical protein